jgi:DNA-directed RNA polymerase II subunit RPB2
MDEDNEIIWNLIDKYFKENPYYLVAHHLDSYNDFFNKGIFQIFRENNPIRWIERESETTGEEIAKKIKKAISKLGDKRDANECLLYLGGKNGDKIYFGKPIIYDEVSNKSYPHYMYPNDARLRSMTYGVTIHYDVDVEYIYYNNEEKVVIDKSYERIYLGKFPIMLHSNLCILKGLNTEVRYNLGECRQDYGGYFIINGKEKAIVSQEKFGDNMLYVRKNGIDDVYSHSCEVHSVSEDSSKPIRYTSVKIVSPSAKYSNNQIVVDIPNVKKPIPLFILMRALGVISDKSIIEYCLLDLETNSNMVDLFIPSIHDANAIFNQELALEFIAKFTKRQSIPATQDILMNYFLPHIGEDNYLNKAYFIGFMVNKILRVFTGKEQPTDRDSFKFKRIETSGSLIYELFREYYLLQKRSIFLEIDKEFYYHVGKYRNNFVSLVEDNLRTIFKNRIVEDGFKKGFKGNWGSTANTKRIGLVQDLNRLSWFTHMSHLRKVNLPLDATAKVVGPHLLHSTQWGLVDPVDTPDGGNIGLHKHLSISTSITNSFSSYPIIKWMRLNTSLQLLTECSPNVLANSTKVFVNGNWIGVLNNPIETINNIKLFRRNGIIPAYTSVSFSYQTNIIYIYTDGGRLTRPIFYRNQKINENGKIKYLSISFNSKTIESEINNDEYSWLQAVTGFDKKKVKDFNIRDNILYDVHELYDGIKDFDDLINKFDKKKGIVDYMDTAEAESSLIANNLSDLQNNEYYTHCEIDNSLIFGIMGNSVIYPEANQFPRNCFSCGQSRQAVSVYHSNATMRMDKTGVVLNYGQIPLIKSKYLKYINNEEIPYGFNAIVAIMSYTGYNVEDAILINEGSVKRGMFRTTYYTTYEAREESSKVSGSTTNSTFANIEKKPNVKGIKDGFDYSKLDKYGLVAENTEIDDRIVIIGEVTSSTDNKGVYIDKSTTTKKGQLGFVDKSFISEGEEGFRIAKVRIREERLPTIGDKMASRAGQKGIVGLIIPEEDMPFNADGIRPDLIINPHAIPSRMTIGQLIECVFGKACCSFGSFGDCTAFTAKGSNFDKYGEMLNAAGYHHSGNEILYSGFTGEQIYSEIFIGPTYYMRLKHMVKDKINYRATGKRNVLTRQTNQGRANDGGLRIGEMDRDAIIAHGISYFLNESYMVRGDQYYMGICNNTGAIAIYNPDANIFLSPLADGPIGFTKNIDGKDVLNSVSKFGRSFSLVRIPYALKLLIHELLAMNVHMRIITEDNVDQLLNLSYQSRNIDKLLNLKTSDSVTISNKISNYKSMLDNKLNKNKSVIQKVMKEETKFEENSREELLRIIKEDYKYDIADVPYTNEQLLTIISRLKKWKEEKEQQVEYDIQPEGVAATNIEELLKNEFGYFGPLKPNLEDPEYPYQYYNQERDKWISVSEELLNAQKMLSEKYKRKIILEPSKYKIYKYMEDIPYEIQYYYYVPLVKGKAPFVKVAKPLEEIDRIKENYKMRSDDSHHTPDELPPVGGGFQIFDEPNMNEIFNELSDENKSQIMKLEPAQRYSVVREILRRNPIKNNGSELLDDAFKALPLDKQFVALQGGYNSMAKEFNSLSKTTPDPLVTINRPVPISQRISEKFPMLSVESDKNDTDEIPNSSSTNDAKEENDGSIKITKLM